MLKKYFIVLILLSSISSIYSQSVTITYRGPESEDDKRMEYPIAILYRALELTINDYDNFKLVPSIRMNSKRATNPDFVKNIPNYVVEATVSDYMESNFLSIKIPTTKGLFGYRLLLIDKNNRDEFRYIQSVYDLKKITFGQGATWNDVKILEDAGLEVITGTSYEGLLSMLIANRFLAFPRGINEAFKEYNNFSSRYPNLFVEESLCIYYPLPKFFYVNKNNTLLYERLKSGLELMVSNGDFDRIWSEHNLGYIQESNLKNRKIIRLENKYIPDIVPLDIDEYWFKP